MSSGDAAGTVAGPPLSAPPHRPIARPITERLLPLLQVLALVCLAFVIAEAAMYLPDPGEEGATAALVFTVLISVAWAVIAVCWIVRARTRSRRLRVALAVVVLVLAVPLTLYGTLGLVFPVLILALALLVLDVSRRAGAIGWAVMALVPPILLIATGEGAYQVATSLFGVGSLEGFGFALGLLWRSHEERGETDRRLLAERDEAVGRLEQAMERLRRAADTEKELVLADERTRAARDLHDGLGHRLTLIAMSLEFAERMRERDPETAWAEVGTARGTATEAMDQMRTWVRALSPVRVADATGLAAFDAIAESFRGTGLEVTVARHGDAQSVELDEDASLLLYRSVQEGLTNALRHGRSRHVAIDVDARAGTVAVTMTSDLDADARTSVPVGPLPRGFGLRGLAERASALGGAATAERVDDHVVLTVRVPVAAGARLPAAAPAGAGPAAPRPAAESSSSGQPPSSAPDPARGAP